MKKLLFLFLFSAGFCVAQPPNTIILSHTYYTSTFDTVKHIPYIVEYELKEENLNCKERFKRKDRFLPDPQCTSATNLKDDYKGSGYDRGHAMSAEDNACSEKGMNECFYYSNMYPQTHSLNAGVWKTLEMKERDMARQLKKIKIFIGSKGVAKTIGIHKVVVPEYCWKVILIENTGEYLYYLFPNAKPESSETEYYKLTKDNFTHQTGISFENGKPVSHP